MASVDAGHLVGKFRIVGSVPRLTEIVKVVQMACMMQVLQGLLVEAKETGFVGSRSLEEIRAEMHYLMQQTFETPATLNR